MRTQRAAAFGGAGQHRQLPGAVQQRAGDNAGATGVLQQPGVCDYELLVQPLAADTRMVLQWVCQEGARKRMFLGVSVHWQQWIHASEPWSVDLPTLTHTTNHVREVDIDARCAELCPAGVEVCLAWAKTTWAAAVQGPCARCETPQRKRLRLMSTGLCARCSLARAIAG